MYSIKHILAVSSLLLIALTSFCQQGLSKLDVKSRAASIKQLLTDADLALKLQPVSVTDNSPLPPSKNQNDFYSWLPYSWPNPATKDGFPYINKDGQTNPETERVSDKPLVRKMAVAAYTLALAYTITKDKKYAQKSATFIRRWFLDPKTKMNPNLNFGQCKPGVEVGTSTGIIDARWFLLVIDAERLLKPSNVITSTESKSLKLWFTDFLDWLLTSKIGVEEGKKPNNHGTWYAAQTAFYANYTGNKSLTSKILTQSKKFFDTQIDSAGRQTLELTRTKAYDYSLYNIHALITLANLGNEVGVDLWHYNIGNGNGKNILQSIKYLAAYTAPTSVWPYKQIADKAISLSMEDGDHFSVYYPYDLYGALVAAYPVYKDPALLKLMSELKSGIAISNRANLITKRN